MDLLMIVLPVCATIVLLLLIILIAIIIRYVYRLALTIGVETGGSGGSVNRVPELLGAIESGAKKFYARTEYANSEKLKSK